MEEPVAASGLSDQLVERLQEEQEIAEASKELTRVMEKRVAAGGSLDQLPDRLQEEQEIAHEGMQVEQDQEQELHGQLEQQEQQGQQVGQASPATGADSGRSARIEERQRRIEAEKKLKSSNAFLLEAVRRGWFMGRFKLADLEQFTQYIRGTDPKYKCRMLELLLGDDGMFRPKGKRKRVRGGGFGPKKGRSWLTGPVARAFQETVVQQFKAIKEADGVVTLSRLEKALSDAATDADVVRLSDYFEKHPAFTPASNDCLELDEEELLPRTANRPLDPHDALLQLVSRGTPPAREHSALILVAGDHAWACLWKGDEHRFVFVDHFVGGIRCLPATEATMATELGRGSRQLDRALDGGRRGFVFEGEGGDTKMVALVTIERVFAVHTIDHCIPSQNPPPPPPPPNGDVTGPAGTAEEQNNQQLDVVFVKWEAPDESRRVLAAAKAHSWGVEEVEEEGEEEEWEVNPALIIDASDGTKAKRKRSRERSRKVETFVRGTRVVLPGANGMLVRAVVVGVDTHNGVYSCQPLGAGDTPLQPPVHLSHSEVSDAVAMEDTRTRYQMKPQKRKRVSPGYSLSPGYSSFGTDGLNAFRAVDDSLLGIVKFLFEANPAGDIALRVLDEGLYGKTVIVDDGPFKAGSEQFRGTIFGVEGEYEDGVLRAVMLVQFGLYDGPGLCRTGTWMTSRYDASAVMLDAAEPERDIQSDALKRAYFVFFPRRRFHWEAGATTTRRMTRAQLRQLARGNLLQLEKKKKEEEEEEEEKKKKQKKKKKAK